MHVTTDGDIFVPQPEWESLLRIAAVEGYAPDEQVAAAAVEALLRNGGSLHYDVDAPVAAVGGVVLRHVPPRMSARSE